MVFIICLPVRVAAVGGLSEASRGRGPLFPFTSGTEEEEIETGGKEVIPPPHHSTMKSPFMSGWTSHWK
jgi:hypothetical protein